MYMATAVMLTGIGVVTTLMGIVWSDDEPLGMVSKIGLTILGAAALMIFGGMAAIFIKV